MELSPNHTGLKNMADDQTPKIVNEETQFPGLKDDGIPDAPPAVVSAPLIADKIAPRELEPVRVPVKALKMQSRRDFLIYGAGIAAAAFGWRR